MRRAFTHLRDGAFPESDYPLNNRGARISKEALLVNCCVVEDEQRVVCVLHEGREEASFLVARDWSMTQRALHSRDEYGHARLLCTESNEIFL